MYIFLIPVSVSESADAHRAASQLKIIYLSIYLSINSPALEDIFTQDWGVGEDRSRGEFQHKMKMDRQPFE